MLQRRLYRLKDITFQVKKNKKEESQKLLAESAKLPNPNVVDPESEEFVFENLKILIYLNLLYVIHA